MTDLNDRVFEEAAAERRTLLPEELVELIERHHAHEQPGVAWEVLSDYAAALDDELGGQFDADSFLDGLEEQVTEAGTWQGPNTLYVLDDDRVSRYPARWHEALEGETDIREYVRFLVEEAEDFEGAIDSGGAGPGVPENDLLRVVAVVGRTDRETAKERLEECRNAGELTEDADQHPDARVRLAE